MSDASTRASRRARSCFRRSASGRPSGMPEELGDAPIGGAGAGEGDAGEAGSAIGAREGVAREADDPEKGAGAAGAAGAGAWGVGGIRGSSDGVGGNAGADRSMEKTAWHLRQRTRAPWIGILSSAIV